MISEHSNKTFSQNVVNAIRSVIGEGRVQLQEPLFRGNELKYLKDCIDSTFVSSVGKYVDRFENELATYTKAKHAIVVVNGTAALHISLKLAGVLSGDEVLVPALTFVATANAVTYCGAVPHFVDSEENTLGISAEKLRDYLNIITEQHSGQCVNRATGQVIRALVVVHTFGHPADINNLLGVARDFNLAFIEDAAESIGSTYHGQHTGTFGLMGTISFNGNKTITTGGGGAILTNETEIARKVKHLTTTAKIPHQWNFVHDEVGYNYRMPNINAALGCAQLEQLPNYVAAKRELFSRYKKSFSFVEGVGLFNEPENCQSNYWLQTIILKKEDIGLRDLILKMTNNDGIITRPVWTLMNRLPFLQNSPQMNLEISGSLSKRLINLPSGAGLV